MLIRAGVEFKQPAYLQAGREALLHTLTAFRRDDGLLRAGLSAVGGDGTAGGYYLWKPEQLSAAIGQDWRNSVHNLLGEEADKVLPFVTVQGAAGKALREKLLSERRVRPLSSDDKALLGWNGLALNAFAAAKGLDPELQQAGEKLAAQLLALTKQDTLPRLIGEPAAGEAQFADRVYLAYGLAAWGKANEQSAFTDAARQLLHDTYQRYYQGKGWVQSEANPLLGEIAVPVIADSQLPSPSALWLVTVWQVADQDPVLRKIAEEISAILPNTLLHWQGLQDTKGWPAPQPLPEKFELIAADVFEPSQGKDGAIRLWVRETDDGEPRVYALPYSRKLHQALFDTKERVAQGRTQVGLLSDGEAGGSGAPVGSGQMLEFRDKPKSTLPPKY